MAFSALYNIGNSIYEKASSGAKAKDALSKMENYDRAPLRNVTTGLSVPTSGFEIQKEQVAQQESDMSAILG